MIDFSADGWEANLETPFVGPERLEKASIDKEVPGMNRNELELMTRLIVAFFEARKHKQKTFDEAAFEVNLVPNLFNLYQSIIDRTYKPSRSMAFVTFKPVTREIFAAPFRDRVVHHYLFDNCAEWWNRRLNYDSYSCRKNKGTLMAVERLVKNERRITKNYTEEAWIFKFDIQSFFMSLPRKRLYETVCWGLARQFPKESYVGKTCDFLWYQIIMDDPTRKARKRGNICNWNPKVLPSNKSLFNQPKGQGIVIGNLTSQLLSNVYLDFLDRYITIELGYKYYGRYVDDFYILVLEKDIPKLKEDSKKIKLFLRTLGLTLHPNKHYAQSIYKGVNFIGANIRPHCVMPSLRVVKNFRNATRLYMMDLVDKEVIISFLGLMKHRDSYKIIQKTFDKVGWEYTDTVDNLVESRRKFGPGRF